MNKIPQTVFKSDNNPEPGENIKFRKTLKQIWSYKLFIAFR